MDKVTGNFKDWILNEAERSNKILAVMLVIIIINYFLPDPIPFIDEILLTPVALIILMKLLKAFGIYKNTPVEKRTKQEKSENDEKIDFVEGEIVE